MSEVKSGNRGSQLRRSTGRRLRRSGRTKPTLAPEYIVGITDGEGCFYVSMKKSKAYISGYATQLMFHLKLNWRDRDVLLKIKKTLGCGNVYFQKEKRLNHTQCYRYTVASREDINNIIIPFFRKHSLQSKTKQKSFKIFCQIADMVKKNTHLLPRGAERIQKLKSKMNSRNVGLA